MLQLCPLNNTLTQAIYALVSDDEYEFRALVSELRTALGALAVYNAPKRPAVEDKPKQATSTARKQPVKRKSDSTGEVAKQEHLKAEKPPEEPFDANTFYYFERPSYGNVSSIRPENQDLASVLKQETPILDLVVLPSVCNVEADAAAEIAVCYGFQRFEAFECGADSSAEKLQPAYLSYPHIEQETDSGGRDTAIDAEKPSMSDASVMAYIYPVQPVDVERVIETHFEELKPQVSSIYALQSSVFERQTELISRLIEENAKLSYLYESQRLRQSESTQNEQYIDSAVASFDCNGIEFSDEKDEPKEPQYDFAGLAKSFGFSEQNNKSSASSASDLKDGHAKNALAEYKQYYYTGELPPPKRQIELLVGGKYSRITKYGVAGRPVKVWY